MPSRLLRITTLFTLCAWLAPTAGALSVGMHLTWSHHDHHENERALEALLQAAAHGHHHDLEATPEHDHSVTLGGDNSSIRKGSDAASTPAGTHRLAHAYDRWSGCDASRRGPPRPLFTDHCSLLL